MPAHSPDTNAFVEVSRAVEQAAGKPIADQRAEFAGSAITGRGRAYATWFGSEPLDWGSLLERWSPSAPAVGQQSVRRLASGGMMANEITQDARVSIAGPTDSRRYVVQDDGSRLKIRPAKGTSIAVGAPEPGERIYALVVRPVAGGEDVTLTLARAASRPRNRRWMVQPRARSRAVSSPPVPVRSVCPAS